MNQFYLSPVDILVVIAVLAAVLGIGLLAARRAGESAESYFLASGGMPWWLIGTAFVSTSVSSEQLVGTVGAAYEHGMGVANWEWFSLPVYIPLLVFFVPLYLKNRVTTVPELLSRRYGPLCANIYSWSMMVAYVLVFLAPVLYSGALALHLLTGASFTIILWSIAAMVAVYTVHGGLRSIMWTEAFQCLLILGGGLILFFVSLKHIPGGWAAMQAAAPERFHLYRPANDPTAPFAGLIAGSFGVFLFYQAANQVMIQRVLTARTTWDGLMGIILAGAINMFRPLVTCFLGFIVYHWIHELGRAPELEDRDQAFAFALSTFAPDWGLRGVVLAGFLSAVMSSTSGLANAIATIFSLDVYKRLLRPHASDGELVRVGRITAAVSLALACLIAPAVGAFGGVFVYFQTGVTYLATPFIAVILVGILWRGANYAGGVAGIIGGFIIVFSLGCGVALTGWNVNWLYVSLIAETLIIFLVVSVSLAFPMEQSADAQRFVWRPSMLLNYDEGSNRPFHQRVGLWFTLYAFAWIGVYYYFW